MTIDRLRVSYQLIATLTSRGHRLSPNKSRDSTTGISTCRGGPSPALARCEALCVARILVHSRAISSSVGMYNASPLFRAARPNRFCRLRPVIASPAARFLEMRPEVSGGRRLSPWMCPLRLSVKKVKRCGPSTRSSSKSTRILVSSSCPN
jgi:hypothetical protein